MTPVWRKVVNDRQRYNPGAEKSRHTGGRTYLKLDECGHEIGRKISDGVPQKARCRKCEQLQQGGESTRFYTDRAVAVEDRWDPTARLPVEFERPMTREEMKYWGKS